MMIRWPGQRNGLIGLSLMSVVLGRRLHPAAATSFLAMRSALFLATGVWIGLADAYRPLAEQDRVFRVRYTSGHASGIWYAGTYWRKRPGVPAAAVPGHSNHGWAMAVDISGYGSTSGRVFRWLLDHAGAFGWSWTTGRNVNEPWHWEYVGSLTRPAGGTIIIIEEEERLEQESASMSTAYATKMPPGVSKGDLDYLRGLLSSGPLVTLDNTPLFALCGDSPGTLANVQLTQLDKLGNAWAADHTGRLEKELDGMALGKGVRWLAWPHFMSTVRAYLTPLSATPAAPGGTFTASDRARLDAVPTAEQNGQAARSAIFKA